MPPPSPRPPFAGWPRQWQLSDGHAWLTPHGPAFITQATCTQAKVGLVHELHDVFDELARDRVEERLPGLVLLHDWRTVTGFDPGVRDAWAVRGARPNAPFRAMPAYIAIGGNKILRMVLKTASLALQMATSAPVARFIDDPEDILRERRIAAPPFGYLGRWRDGGA
jgi:hypothetical protein